MALQSTVHTDNKAEWIYWGSVGGAKATGIVSILKQKDWGQRLVTRAFGPE